MLALALAAWLRCVRGTDERGNPLIVTHPLAALLREKAIERGSDPRPLLSIGSLFGELGGNLILIEATRQWLVSLYDRGIEVTLEKAAALASA